MIPFKKNRNEAAYFDGKKYFIDVIKNTGDSSFLIWRQPEEDFNTHSKLIVMPGETAVFVDGGNVVQTFEEGTYELSTNNYPFIGRLKNCITGGISTFNCVIYFFRKADSGEIKWGTSDPIQVRDKVYGIRTSVQARGSYKVRIENPVLFLEKLVGNNIRYQEQSDLMGYFKNEMLTKIKSCINKFLLEYEHELIGLEAYLSEISGDIEKQINEMFVPYGLSCVNFSVMALAVDTAKYDDIDEAQIANVKKVKQGIGQNTYMNTLGNNWDKMQSASIMRSFAQNEGGGSITSMGAGLGVAMGISGTVGNMASQVFQNAPGAQQTSPKEDPIEVLGKLKQLLDAGLITEDDYNAKKTEVLSRM